MPDEPRPVDATDVTLPSPQTIETRIDVPVPDQPPPLNTTDITRPSPKVPETKVELPAPEEPPPLATADLKPVAPAKPIAPAKPGTPANPAPARPAQKPAVTQTETAPNTGTAQVTQTAVAQQPLIVWEHHPRFRTPPRPAVYPPRAIELGQQGEALVRVRLEPSGAAAEILLWRGTGHAMLDNAALAAVRGWQFLPAMREGRAVAAWVEIPVRFHLR
jgi:protein TonB